LVYSINYHTNLQIEKKNAFCRSEKVELQNTIYCWGGGWVGVDAITLKNLKKTRNKPN
jgi:hypothetical protein